MTVMSNQIERGLLDKDNPKRFWALGNSLFKQSYLDKRQESPGCDWQGFAYLI